MRIQHNIMAMNSYRNYSNNTSALSKNLEKLSSGYKINRAGDDAAGLAISEKMRAQITGLTQAQANAKSGINLVQTAEGALTEVHDMLNRMVKLADQSANGTYDNDVDRANLQKEVTQLQSEIDRIADSSNFNGIKLLDGSMGGPKVEATAGTAANAAGTAGVAAIYATGDLTASTLTGTGNKDLTIGGYTASIDVTTNDDLQKQLTAFVAAYNADTDTNKTWAAAVGADNKSITFTAKKVGTLDTINATAPAGTTEQTAGVDDTQSAKKAQTSIDFTDKTGEKVIGGTVTIGGKTYEFVKTGEKASKDTNVAVSIAEDAKADAIATALKDAIGTNVANFTAEIDGTNTAQVNVVEDTAASVAGNLTAAPTVTVAGMGLTLQIGDTSDSFNKLTVSIKDMHTTALGIDDKSISIATQSAAAAAVDKIKAAINSVSDMRGTLGATQNRLDHTINNLSVMTENIQDAESTIRDTDVAEEMMAYTKNNILVQSAQAMLAQANQVPQGVLQLLQ